MIKTTNWIIRKEPDMNKKWISLSEHQRVMKRIKQLGYVDLYNLLHNELKEEQK